MLNLALACVLVAAPGATVVDSHLLQPMPNGVAPDDHVPSFHPDGDRILFTSTRTGQKQIFVVEVGPGTVTPITRGPSYHEYGAFSPDGEFIAVHSNHFGPRELCVLRADGTGIRRLTTGGHSLDERPAWSPDGERIAFDWGRGGSQDLWVLTLASGELEQITTNSGFDAWPSWSPVGDELAFLSRRSGGSDLYLIRADGSDERPLLRSPVFKYSPSWSPDGSRIAFWSTGPWDSSIWTVRADGSEVRLVAQRWFRNWSPTWSPDGSTVAFGSTSQGNRGIWVMNADGTDARQITNAEPSDFFRTVLTDGVAVAFERLTYSTRVYPEAQFTSTAEVHHLVRRLVDDERLDEAVRVGEWWTRQLPHGNDAADIWNYARRARGDRVPVLARELAQLPREGDWAGFYERIEECRRDFPAWPVYTHVWWRTQLENADRQGLPEHLLRCSEHALVDYPQHAGYQGYRALALHGLGRADEARAAAQEALALDPSEKRARWVLDATERPERDS